MAAANDFAVHNVTIKDEPNFNRAGGVTMQKTVTFYVGDHGPFRNTYPITEATAEKINTDIDAQVAMLRAVVLRDVTQG